jgi:hypothetical protein
MEACWMGIAALEFFGNLLESYPCSLETFWKVFCVSPLQDRNPGAVWKVCWMHICRASRPCSFLGPSRDRGPEGSFAKIIALEFFGDPVGWGPRDRSRGPRCRSRGLRGRSWGLRDRSGAAPGVPKMVPGVPRGWSRGIVALRMIYLNRSLTAKDPTLTLVGSF